MESEVIRLKGAPGSPYTRKMLALLRFRRLPYELILGGHDADTALPEPKVSLLPTFYLHNDNGDLEAVVDSTPVIRRLEESHSNDRSVIPTNPVLAFLDALLEDYADEWLTKAMFHYRWHYADDIHAAGEILPRWHLLNAPEEQVAIRRAQFTQRQINRLYVVGSNMTTAPVIEASYKRYLALMSEQLLSAPYLFGNRPSSADFAAFGQLTQLAQFDPTPRALTFRSAPRVFAWVDIVEDLSGLPIDEAGWYSVAQCADRLRPLLREIGSTYVPVMLANARALNEGQQEVNTQVHGARWVQQVFPYQARCVAELRTRYARLEPSERDTVDQILAGTGCEAMFAPPAG